QSGFACNGAGACLPDQQVDCNDYACALGACKTACLTNDDCAASAYCDGSACTPRTQDGAACSIDDACSSGLCIDGVCCNAPCSGQCEACDVAGSVGSCVPVLGAPHGVRPACPSGPPDALCKAVVCDGIT